MTVTAIDAYQPSSAALAIRPGQEMWTDKQRAALTALGIKSASSADLAVFMHYCQKTGLDPFSKQIYMICRREKQGDQWVDRQTIQVGIEGFRVIRDRAAARLGIEVEYEDTIWYDPDGGEHKVWLQDAPPSGCTVTVLKNGRRYPGTLRFSEYVQTRNGDPVGKWRDAPSHQIEKCAEAFSLRRAFPHDLGGVYIEEEMPQQEPGGPAVIRQGGRVTVAEVIAAEPVASAAPAGASVGADSIEPGSVETVQVGKLQGLYSNRFGFTRKEHDQTIGISEKIVGRELTGPRDGRTHGNLSAHEASKLLGTLEGYDTRGALIAALADRDGAGPAAQARGLLENDEVLNPVDLERAISEVTDRIAKGVKVITGAERKANALRRDYDLARALAYTHAEGSIKDKEAASVIETMESRRLAEDAEAEYKHAQRTAAALEKQLSGLQAQAKLVGAMFGAVRA